MVDLTAETGARTLALTHGRYQPPANDIHRSPRSLITIVTLTNKNPPNFLLICVAIGGIAAGSGPTQFLKI